MNRRALISGIYGQDGSYLCEQLMSEGYEVHGITRARLSENSQRIEKELSHKGIKPIVHPIDMMSLDELSKLVKDLGPDEFYHVAAYHVSAQGNGNAEKLREQEIFLKNITMTSNVLESCLMYSPNTRVFTAGSCLMYDASESDRQDENTPYRSMSLYGIGKVSENGLVQYYRNKGLFACTGVLYNHESHRRGASFVTKKIVENMVGIKHGKKETFTLGCISVQKDWGHASDYMKAARLMLAADKPEDYIIATGEMHSIREFLEICSEILQINDWMNHVEYDDKIIQRIVAGRLCGDASLLKKELGWKREYGFRDMIKDMVYHEELEQGGI